VRLAGLGVRIDAELTTQGALQVDVHRQRRRALTVGGEGGHQVAMGLFVERVGDDGGLGRAPGCLVVPRSGCRHRCQVSGGAPQPTDLLAQHRYPVVVGEIDEPVVLTEQIASPGRGRARQAVLPCFETVGGLGDQFTCVVDVRAPRAGGQEPICRARAGDHVVAEDGPQPADEGCDVGGCVARLVGCPQDVGNAFGRDEPATLGSEQLEQQATLA
jgi:hypothetical protein